MSGPLRIIATGDPNNIRYFSLVKQFPPGEPIVALCVCDNTVYAATSRRIFVVRNDVAFPLDIAYETVNPPPAIVS